MLKGINPLLNADILHALASMGHGDRLVICDANFPSAAVAAESVLGHHLEMSVDAIVALEAILSVFPVDTFDVDVPPACGMQVVGAPNEIPEVVKIADPLIKDAGANIELIERHAFYASAKQTYVVIRTTETRFYGNFILRKGVVWPK